MKYVTKNYLSIIALSLSIVVPGIHSGTSYALSCMEMPCSSDTECDTGYCYIDAHTCVNRYCKTDPDCMCSATGGCNRNCEDNADCDQDLGLECIMTSAGVKACRCPDDDTGTDAYCTTCGGAIPTPGPNPTPTSNPGACNQNCIVGAVYPNPGSCNTAGGLMCYNNKCKHKDCLLDDNCICSTAGICNAKCDTALGCRNGRVCRNPEGLGCGNPECIEDIDCICEDDGGDEVTSGSCFLGDDDYYRKLNCSGRCSSIPTDETGVPCVACGPTDAGVCATQPNGEIFDSCCMGSVPELNDAGECVCNPTKNAVNTLFTNINGLMIPITIILGIFLIVLKGYKIMTSQGDPTALQEGKEGLTSAIIGLIFVLLAVSILRVIIKALISGDADPFVM